MARNKFDIDEELISPFNLKHLMRLFRYMKPYKRKVFVTMLLMILSSIATLSGPYIIKNVIDTRIPAGDVLGLVLLAVVFLVLIVVAGIILRIRIKTMTDIGQSVIRDIRSDLFKHLQKLPFAFFDGRPHGKILVRVVNYVNSLSDLLSNGIINVITDMFSLIVIIGFMLLIDLRLTLLCMAGLPLLVLAVFLIKNAQRKAWQSVSRKLSNLNAYIHESISGIKVTQSFSRETENARIFDMLNTAYRTSWMKAVRVQFLLWPSVENISLLSLCLVYVMGISWLSKGVTVGMLIAFTSYIGRFWMPIINLGNFYNSIVQAIAYLERIFEAMDEEVVIKDLPEAFDIPLIQGNVEFNDVSFGYEKGEQVLHNVSFKVEPGETVALVGPTGAGKTTIINLLSRFYDVTGGSVAVDGIDVRNATLQSLRSQMGIMMQDTFLFSGTIADNIRYGKLDATDDEVIRAAKVVRAHEFIMAQKEGYKTEVNERGSRLSTGQRQLISFARALLADPRILILDEATSSIDTETEKALQQGLSELLKDRTSFIIAHRLSTIRNATRIMYIDDGRIAEEGTHEELVRLKGLYYEMYMAQFDFIMQPGA